MRLHRAQVINQPAAEASTDLARSWRKASDSLATRLCHLVAAGACES